MEDYYRDLLKKYIAYVSSVEGQYAAFNCVLVAEQMGDFELDIVDRQRLEDLFDEINREL